jgi:hypothetical protein
MEPITENEKIGYCVISLASKHEIEQVIATEKEKFKWAYLGEQITKKILIENMVGEKGTLLETGEMLQKIANETLEKYVEYIGKISLKKNSLEWWVGSVSEKSPYSSKIFLKICYLKTYNELVKKYGHENLIIFVDDNTLRKTMYQNPAIEVTIKSYLKESKLEQIKKSMVGLKDIVLKKGYFVGNNIYKMILAKWIYRMQNTIDKKIQYDVLHTFATKRSFDLQNKKFNENFYGGLIDYAKKSGRNYAIFPSIWGTPYLGAMKILKKEEKILVSHAFISIADILRSLIKTMKIPRADYPKFEWMDINNIIDEEIKTDYAGIRMPSDILNYYTIKNMQKKGILISNFIDLYENHTGEKAIRLAMKEFYPNSRLVGYQHSTFSSMHLEYIFSKEELPIMPFPDRIITSGDHDKEVFEKWGYPKEKLVKGGAIRYDYLLDMKKNSGKLNLDRPAVLVTTSINKPDALELIWKTIMAFQNEKKYRIIIKCHPYMPFSKIIKELGIPIPLNFEISETPIPKLLEEADILVYTSSTTCLEAIAKGVPIIYVKSDLMIELNQLDFDPEIAFCANKPEDILRGVEYYLNLSDDKLETKRKRWSETVRKMFGKVDDSVYSLFFKK